MAAKLDKDKRRVLLERFSAAVSILVMLMSAGILCGWAFKLTFLKSLYPGLSPVPPANAICFMLIGASIWARQRARRGKYAKILPKYFSFGVILICCSVVFEYLLNLNFSVERMSLLSLLNFLLISAIFSFLDEKNSHNQLLAQLIFFAGGIISLVAIVGYIDNTLVFYDIAPYKPMSLYSAIIFLLVCFSGMALNPGYGLTEVMISDSEGGVLLRRVYPVILGVPLVTGWLISLGIRYGLFAYSFGISLFVLVIVVVFTILIWGNAIFMHAMDNRRREIENKCRDSQRLFADIIDFLPDAAFVIDLQGKVIAWNQAMERMTNIKAADILGKGDYEYALPFYGIRRPILIDYVLQKNTDISDKYSLVHIGTGMLIAEAYTPCVPPAGAYVWGKASILTDSEGKIIGSIETVRDISEHKKVEAALEEQKKFVESLLQNSSLPSLAIDLNHKVILWNKACEEFTGLSAERMIGTTDHWKGFYNFKRPTLIDIVLDEDFGLLPVYYAKYSRSSLSPTGWHVEGWFIGPTGIRRYMLLEATAIYGKNGKIIAAIQSYQEVTSLKLAEEQLRKLSSAIEQSKTAIVITDIDGNINYVNPMFSQLTGYRAEEIMGKNPRILKSGQMYPDEYKKLWATISSGGEWHGEFHNRKKNGELYWEMASISAVRDDDGKVISFIKVAEDISERKQSESKLAKIAAELKRSNSDLEEFAYVASHDLQEPLRMVTSYVQLLSQRYKGKLDKDADDFINYAVDGSMRMHVLINDLLAYSRVGTKGKEFSLVNMEEIFEKAIMNLKLTIEENKAVITHDPLPAVMADEMQMLQLLQNLIGNAIKFHGEKTPMVHVWSQRQDQTLLFGVRDNGIGIDPQYFSRIFGIFHRLHTREEYPGTGIGLAVCKKIVERHKGRIWVESKLNEGAAFYFTIPGAEGEERW